MPSWACRLCEEDNRDRWPTKQQAMDHIEANHLDTLIRASLVRSEHDPTEDLGVEV